ncbi:putative inositol-polyphosphate 5-phosphatase [Helianthus debilis subsp. tardiflorus]
MRDANCKTNKLSWSKKLVRNWFNIKTKSEETHGDDNGGSFCEREPPAIKKSKTGTITILLLNNLILLFIIDEFILE